MARYKNKRKLVEWTENFDKRIYPPQAVSQAVKDYGALGTFSMKEISGKIEVNASIPAETDFNFREEFSNYVLGMVFKCR